MPTKRTQPYRQNLGRRRTAALTAMKRGKPAYMANPMDARRKAQRKRRKSLRSVIRGY